MCVCVSIVGEYWVVGVDIEQYDPTSPSKYLHGLLKDTSDAMATRAYRSYLGVVPSPPFGMQEFNDLVNSYLEQPPFNFTNAGSIVGGVKLVSTQSILSQIVPVFS